MTDPPRDPDLLAAIRARWFTDGLHRAEYWADLASRDVPLLVDLADKRGREVGRLRDLLARLEWGDGRNRCSACGEHKARGHEPGCWLAEALTSNEEAPPSRS
jgi:hypothetical protein